MINPKAMRSEAKESALEIRVLDVAYTENASPGGATAKEPNALHRIS